MNPSILIKTFRSNTLQGAFEQIRNELGPDASILGTTTKKYGVFSRNRIEVTASSNTLEYEQRTSDKEGSSNHSQTSGKNPSSDPSDPSVSSIESMEQDSRPQPVSASISIHDSNADHELISNHLPGTRVERICAQVLQELLDSGIARVIADQWIAAAQSVCNESVFQDAWSLRAELLSWIRGFVHAAAPLDLETEKQQIIAFIGPTGSGKTTTLAKIAANLSIDNGFKLGVIQTDARQSGSCSMLANYAEMLGWQLETVASIEQLKPSLEKLASCRFVLMDTQGCSPTDEQSLLQTEAWLEVGKPTAVQLVISSTCSDRSFMRFEKCFGGMNPSSLILTKLDEAGGLGPLFSFMQSSSLPVSYLTNGQNVPSDLMPATSARLAQHIFAGIG